MTAAQAKMQAAPPGVTVREVLDYIALAWQVPAEKLQSTCIKTGLGVREALCETFFEIRSESDRQKYGVPQPHRAFLLKLQHRILIVKILIYNEEERHCCWFVIQCFARPHPKGRKGSYVKRAKRT